MIIYIIIVAAMVIGYLLLINGNISKKQYCIAIGLILLLVSGLRSVDVGMWDTKSIYIPSFKIIYNNDIKTVLSLPASQYKSIGYVLLTKLIGTISHNENFYIFVMSLPFFICSSILIYKYSDKPLMSYICILTIGFFTYSFSMVRGMVALAIICIAYDKYVNKKTLQFFVLVALAATFHIVSLIFLLVPLVDKIHWSMRSIIIVLILTISLSRFMPAIWKNFVENFVSIFMPNYRYYGSKEGTLATGMLLIYILILARCILELWTSGKIKRKAKSLKSKGNELYYKENNLELGMTVFATILVSFTPILDEFIRIALYFGIGTVVLTGKRYDKSSNNKVPYIVIDIIEASIMLLYFFGAELYNMNAVPYEFFF